MSCTEKTESTLVAKGGPEYGGEFRFISPEKITTLLPVSVTDIYTHRITSQLFENLLKMDAENLHAMPSLAKHFSESEDGKTYTFYLRENVFFHADACFGGSSKQLTAEDVKFSLEFACSGLAENEISSLLTSRIVGAKSFNKKTKKQFKNESISGIKIIDKQTIEIQLVDASATFDKIITHPSLAIFPREAYEKYGNSLNRHPVGTGAFQLEKWTKAGISLKRNPNYWRKDRHGNQLPFLDRISMRYSEDKRTELFAFRKQEIDLVLEIPSDEIQNVLGSLKDAQSGLTVKHKVDSKSSLSLNYLAFRLDEAPFSDIRVRQALTMALDKNELVENWLGGEGFPMLNGIVPSMKGYESDRVNGTDFSPEKARQKLAEAGFSGGSNFPPVKLYINTKSGSMLHELAKGVVAQWKINLNIDIQIKLTSYAELKQAIRSGEAKMWRNGWIADYPDAENFLALIYGENLRNDGTSSSGIRYNNETFNTLFESSWKEKNDVQRMDILRQCDEILMKDAVLLPLTNDDFFTMIHSKFKDFSSNSLEVIDFSVIFVKEPKR
jgi:peptide/nickel transport system substrate-binding protein